MHIFSFSDWQLQMCLQIQIWSCAETRLWVWLTVDRVCVCVGKWRTCPLTDRAAVSLLRHSKHKDLKQHEANETLNKPLEQIHICFLCSLQPIIIIITVTWPEDGLVWGQRHRWTRPEPDTWTCFHSCRHKTLHQPSDNLPAEAAKAPVGHSLHSCTWIFTLIAVTFDLWPRSVDGNHFSCSWEQLSNEH